MFRWEVWDAISVHLTSIISPFSRPPFLWTWALLHHRRRCRFQFRASSCLQLLSRTAWAWQPLLYSRTNDKRQTAINVLPGRTVMPTTTAEIFGTRAGPVRPVKIHGVGGSIGGAPLRCFTGADLCDSRCGLFCRYSRLFLTIMSSGCVGNWMLPPQYVSSLPGPSRKDIMQAFGDRARWPNAK